MRYSDIKEKHIYKVIFNPTRQCEFDGEHLAIVVKKNSDNKTAIVIPMTSKSKGEGINKVNVGKITTLPDSLNKTDSFVVYDQVRTVNSSRFIFLKQDGNKVQCPVDEDLYSYVVSLCTDELISVLSNEEIMEIHQRKYVEFKTKVIIDSTYELKRLITNSSGKETIIASITKIRSLCNGFDIGEHLEEKDRKNGILEMINKVISGALLPELFPEEVTSA